MTLRRPFAAASPRSAGDLAVRADHTVFAWCPVGAVIRVPAR